MKSVFLIAIVALTMSGCGIYKTYERSPLQIDSLYRDVAHAERITSDNASLANLSWRELFTDDKLQQLIEVGLEHNTDLRIAQLRVQEAEATLKSARLSYLPSFSIDPQGTISSYDNSKATKTYQLALSANWELDVFGRLTNAKLGSKAAVQQSQAYQQAVRTQLIATIANSYYSLLLLDSQIATSNQTLDNWKQSIKTMRILKQAGKYNEAAIAQAEANHLAVQSSVLSLQQQINELENSLSTLLGHSARAIERGELSEQNFPEHLSVGVPLQLLNNRPDVRQSEYALTEAFYATNQARSAFYPSISLSGSGGWTNSAGQAITNPAKLLMTAIGSLSQPLFNKGTNRARLNIAKAQQEEASLSFQQSLLNAGAEVNNALTQWQTARKQIVIDGQQIASLRIALRSTQLLMQHGNTTYLEVLTAQQSLLQSELTQFSNRFNEIQGVINLYHSLGGGI